MGWIQMGLVVLDRLTCQIWDEMGWDPDGSCTCACYMHMCM
jgi:hypothetical protein